MVDYGVLKNLQHRLVICAQINITSSSDCSSTNNSSLNCQISFHQCDYVYGVLIRSDSQEITLVLWSQKVHYDVHSSPTEPYFQRD
jgi:hypothetical protein